jgi:hypothetical protein
MFNDEGKYLKIYVKDKDNNQFPLAHIAMGLASIHTTGIFKSDAIEKFQEVKREILARYKQLEVTPILGTKNSCIISVDLQRQGVEKLNLNDIEFVERNIKGIEEYKRFVGDK